MQTKILINSTKSRHHQIETNLCLNCQRAIFWILLIFDILWTTWWIDTIDNSKHIFILYGKFLSLETINLQSTWTCSSSINALPLKRFQIYLTFWFSIPKSVQLCTRNISYSEKEPSSRSNATLSLAVSLPWKYIWIITVQYI